MPNDGSPWREESASEWLAHRSVDYLPGVTELLRKGNSILDVGCGPGSITTELASLVAPGRVFGVDVEPDLVQTASDRARKQGITNVTFQLGDALSLPFESDRFDAVLSHALLPWVTDPVATLREQRRVVRNGGWVFAHNTEFGSVVFYPACPALEQVIGSLGKVDASDGFFPDLFAGRKMALYLREAGFTAFDVKPRLQYAYSPGAEFGWVHDIWMLFLSDDGPFSKYLEQAKLQGFITADTVTSAKDELEVWHADPSAAFMHGEVCAIAHT